MNGEWIMLQRIKMEGSYCLKSYKLVVNLDETFEIANL